MMADMVDGARLEALRVALEAGARWAEKVAGADFLDALGGIEQVIYEILEGERSLEEEEANMTAVEKRFHTLTGHLAPEQLDELDQFAVVEATFQPAKIDNLRADVHPLIGLRTRFERLWTMDETDTTLFVGQSAWQAMTEDGLHHHPDMYRWIPTEDLVDAVLVSP